MRLQQYLMRLSANIWMVVCAVMLCLIGLLDYSTGMEVNISVFYLIPVFLACWFVGKFAGILLSVLGAVTWFMTDIGAGRDYSHHGVAYWNTAVMLSFFLIVTFSLSALKRAFDHVNSIAKTDPLTGAANMRAFLEVAGREIALARRHARVFSLAYLDLDNFKLVNDKLGHTTGDELLRTFAAVLNRETRAADFVARVGGDEFVILFPDTDEASATRALQRLEKLIGAMMQARGWPVTMSVGLVTFRRPPDSVDAMIGQADSAMYRAKGTGKNTTCYESFPVASAPGTAASLR
jgi:diguanylate cyclase (GGDEF)-like protein